MGNERGGETELLGSGEKESVGGGATQVEHYVGVVFTLLILRVALEALKRTTE